MVTRVGLANILAATSCRSAEGGVYGIVYLTGLSFHAKWITRGGCKGQGLHLVLAEVGEAVRGQRFPFVSAGVAETPAWETGDDALRLTRP